MSITNIDITDTTINVSIKVFVKDMTHHINKTNQIDHDFHYYKTNQDGINLIDSYMQNNLNLKIDNKFVVLVFENIKWEDESLIVNYNTKLLTISNEIYVENKILMDCFHDQSNLIIFNKNGIEKGLQLNNDKWAGTVVF